MFLTKIYLSNTPDLMLLFLIIAENQIPVQGRVGVKILLFWGKG